MITKFEDCPEDSDGHQRLSILNETRLTLPGPRYLHELVTSHNSNTIAIDHLSADCARRQISYQQLQNHVQYLASVLRPHVTGHGHQRIVPVIMPQCPELYIADLAILELGAAFCPILPDVPAERLKFVVSDVEADLVLTAAEHYHHVQSILSDIKVLQISLNDLESRNFPHPGPFPLQNGAPNHNPSDIAYVMYTSGSTGLPKGVRIPHISVCQSLLAHDEHIPVFKRFLQFASPTFDVSVFEIFFPLFRGATLVCCERERMLADLPKTINQLQVDAAELTPTVAGTLLKTRAAAPNLQVLLTIGEMLSKHVVEEFGGSESQQSILYAMYGPTEAAIHCTLAPRLSATSSVKNIGIPFSTVTALILSETSSSSEAEILPFGKIGELAIAGQLADGYLNRPEQTAAAFIELPEYGPMYRTGDRAMMLEDNTIQILGRISAGQVKLRGQRVELGEIEETVCKTPDIELAVASVINDSLIVFCSGSGNASVAAVQATCKAWLPRYMRPNDIVLLSQGMPRLPSGKVDRRKLADDYSSRPEQTEERTVGEEWDDVERRVVSVMETELDTTITPRTSLWASGLDSLKSIKITSILRTSFPQITATMLFQSDTISEVASQLQEAATPQPRIDTHDSIINRELWQQVIDTVRSDLESKCQIERLEDVLPCHPMQVAMLTETMAENTVNYNSITLELQAAVRPEDVRNAFGKVAAHNKILRSGFMETGNTECAFVQLVWDQPSFEQELSLTHPMQITANGDDRLVDIRIHHALYDGWSWDLIMSDVNEVLSESRLQSRPQYSDFCILERQQRDMNYERDREYWSGLLQDATPCHMPNLRSARIPTRTNRSCQRLLSTNSQSWTSFAQTHRISRQTILQTSLFLLLSAYCDKSDIICGVVSSGRERPFPGIDQLIGPCLSTYPMRIDLASVETLADLLHYVQRCNIRQMTYGSLSLSEMSQAAQLPASQRLFDTLCVWQEGLTELTSVEDLVKTKETLDSLHYSFVLEAGPEADRIWTKLTFNEAILPIDHAELFLSQMDCIVSAVMSSVKYSITDVWNYLDDHLLSQSHAEPKSFSGPYDLTATIRRLAKEDPDRVAVQFVTAIGTTDSQHTCHNLSYQDLYNRASAAATRLVNLFGMRQDDLICIILEKSPDLYVAILASIVAGAGYMCIDPQTPDQRISRILSDAKCKLIVTDQVARIKNIARDLVALTEPTDLLSFDTSEACVAWDNVDGDALAYAVFTSGSTGVPKGVLVTRKNLASNIHHLAKIYPYNAREDKLLQSCSQAFDVSVFEIFWTWHVGLTLCSATKDVLFQDIEAFIRTLAITHLSMTPSVAALVSPDNVPCVKFLVTAGEPMNSKVFDNWAGRGLYQGYGPSETTNICNVRPRVLSNDFINNVGPAFDNTSIFICSRQSPLKQNGTIMRPPEFKLLPRGASGEIWIGGDQVGRGYIDSKLTARSWIDHPQYGRLYKSGDMGCLLADESLIILGREDDQVKLRGLRIELGEINSVLIRHSNIKDAASLVTDREGRPQLISFCVFRHAQIDKDKSCIVTDVFSYLEERLADYMVPDAVIPIEEIPLTHQGKIDSRQLRDSLNRLDSQHILKYTRGYEHSSDETPLSETEQDVAAAISDLMGYPSVAVQRHTSFYSMGLDSIQSINLAQMLRKKGFENLDVSVILKNPSVARLAKSLSTRGSKAFSCSDDKSGQVFDEGWKNDIQARYEQNGYKISAIMPCTPLQEIMLSSDAAADSTAYYNHLKWTVCCDIDRLREAWTKMVHRHEILRTAFATTNDPDKPYAQVVLDSFPIPWSKDKDAHTQVNPADDLELPPYSMHIRKGDDKMQHVLSLKIHHAIYDAAAMSILLNEIEQVVKGRDLPPAPLFASYVDYMLGMDSNKTDHFWKETMREVKPSRIKEHINLGQGNFTATGAHTICRTSNVSLLDLEKGARTCSATILTMVQAALVRLVSYCTSSSDVCFGNVLSGRTLPIMDVNQIVGPCFNTLPVRAKLEKGMAMHELIASLNQQNIDVLPYQPSSLRRIQRLNSPDGKALFDMLLLLQQEDVSLDEQIWILDEDAGYMSFPFIIEVVPFRKNNRIELRLHHEVGEISTVKEVLKHFDTFLEHTVKYFQAGAANFEMIDASASFLKAPPRSSPKPQNDKPSSSRDLDPTEREVCRILHDLSPLESTVSVNHRTTIFKLGLDSISAIQLAIRLRQQGYQIKAAQILEGPTIEEIASCCNQASDGQPQTPNADILRSFSDKFGATIRQQVSNQKRAIEDILPCTPSQSGILSQFVGSSGALYYNRISLRLEQSIDIRSLKQAWLEATRMHMMLRTGFVQLESASYPFAMIVYKADIHEILWEHMENAPLDAVTRGRRVLDDLKQPPWEIVVSRENEQFVLDLWMLHALYDAKSVQRIFSDVVALYKQATILSVSSIKPIVEAILGAARDTDEAQKFWTAAGSDLQSTKFPDMSIYREPPARLVGLSRTSNLSMQQIQSHCSELDVSFQVVCQATWSRILAAYCGQATVSFGVILSGRMFDDQRLNDAVFPCINTVPFAVQHVENDHKLLSIVSQRNAGVTKFQHTPLTTIKRWNDISDNLFDTVLVLQKFENSQNEHDIWTTVEDEASGEYTVSLEILPHNNDCTFQLTYRPDLIPKRQAEILLEEFDQILREILQIGNDRHSTIHSDVLSHLPPTDERISSTITFLHEFVEKTAQETPDAIALEFISNIEDDQIDRVSWNYAELDARGNQIANALIQHGTHVGELVAVCFDKCPEASFAILGVLKAGCAYVAIDPGAPEARKSFILEDANCRLLLTSSDKADMFDQNEVELIVADDEQALSKIPYANPELKDQLTAEHSCYCLYTSGTTGTPKGCLISHQSAVQAMLSFSRIFQGRWTKNSRWLQFASFHFDVSVLEQYWSWSVGICMTSIPRDLLFEDLPANIAKLGITHLDLTPSLAKLITPETVPSLCDGVFIVGGEQVQQEVLDTWGPAGCLYNFYGPSEVTIGCTVHRQVLANTRPTNIGQQWDNVGSFVLDADSENPVVRGAVGELCLSGPLVGKGYLHRPELTEKKFVFLKNYDTRIYRTGDLVRLLHDDSFDFLGRIDGQIKLRGQRLEVGEINHVIGQSSDRVIEVSTVVLKHPQQDKEQLVAFFSTSNTPQARQAQATISTDPNITRLADDLRSKCTSKLPAYMVPTYFIGIDFMPLSANNKIDNKILASMYQAASIAQLRGSQERPSTASQGLPEHMQHLIEICAKYFDVEVSAVLPESKLFELGLDSISVLGLSRVLRREGFKRADIPTIMKNSIMIDLCRALEQESNGNEARTSIEAVKMELADYATKHKAQVADVLDVDMREIEDISPSTPLQQGMISKVMSSNSQSIPYFAFFTYNLCENTTLRKLQLAWNETAKKLGILRTRFVSTEDGYAQVVIKKAKIPLLHLTGDVDDQDIAQAFQDWVNASKSLGPVLPWQLCFTENQNCASMTIFLFHGLYDGISLLLLLEAVEQEYLCQSPDSKPIQFHEMLPYGPLQKMDDAKEFWIRELQYINRLNITPALSETRATIRLSETINLKNVKQLCTHLNVTTPAVFHAAWLYTLFNHYDVNPTLGLVLSGRSIGIEGVESVIGPMFNTIPCSINTLSHPATLQDLIKSCHEFSMRALPYQHSSIRDISKWIGRNPREGLFDSLLVFQKTNTTISSGSDKIWVEKESGGSPDYPLNLEVEQCGDDGSFNITLLALESSRTSRDDMSPLLDSLNKTVADLADMRNPMLPEEFTNKNQQPMFKFAVPSAPEVSVPQKNQGKWTEEATKIRDELAELSQTNPETIGLSSPSIFELGFDSIDALKLAARLKKRGLNIAISAVMLNPTIDGIAANCQKLEQALKERPAQLSIEKQQKSWYQVLSDQGIDVKKSDTILPVTSMQEGLLLNPSNYYHVLSYVLSDNTDHGNLSAAIKQLVEIEPILRAQFVPVEDAVVHENFLQIVKTDVPFEVDLLDLNDNDELEKVRQDMRQQAIDQGLKGQYPRASIAKSMEGRRFLLLGLPHAMYDGWSLGLLHSKITSLYHNVPQPQPSLQLLSKYLNEVRKQSKDGSTKRFWQDRLRHPKFTQYSLPSTQQKRRAILIDKASCVPLNAITGLCKTVGITMQSLGLACWAASLAHNTRCLDVLHGMVLSGRTVDGSDTLTFPTFNTVIFRTRLAEDMTCTQFLKEVHRQSLNVLEHSHFPLKESLRLINDVDGEGFNTLFTFQKTPGVESKDQSLYQEYDVNSEAPNPPYAVNVEMTERDGQVWWTCAVQDNVATTDEVDRILEQLDRLINFFVENRDVSIVRFSESGAIICGLEPAKLRHIEDSSTTKNPRGLSDEVDEQWNDVELKIRSVLAHISQANSNQIQKTTSIFHLGLDSISAIKISGQLRRNGLKISVSEAIRAQTIESMAKLVVKQDTSSPLPVKQHSYHDAGVLKEISSLTSISKLSIESVQIAAAGQVYMLDAWKASQGRLFYADFWLEAKGVNKQEFERAFKTLTNTVPALRTTFIENEGLTYAVTLKADTISSCKYPWRLESIEENGRVLARLKIHHALYDAVGLHIMVDSLTQLCRDTQMTLKLNTDFAPFLRLTRNLSTALVDTRKSFWSSYLSSAVGDTKTTLRGQFSSPRIEKFVPNLVHFHALRPALKKFGISIQTLFFAAYARVHANLQVSVRGAKVPPKNIILGTYMANRFLEVDNLDSLVAPTFNILPIKIATRKDTTLIETAKQIQVDLQEISNAQHCGASLRDIHEWTGLTIDGYMNFLRLPDDQDEKEREDDDESKNEIRVTHAEGQSLYDAQSTMRDEVKAAFTTDSHIDTTSHLQYSPYFVENQLQSENDETNQDSRYGYIIPAIDVEARVMADGYLAMGVFAPSDLLNDRGVDKVIEEVKILIESVIEK